MFGRLNLNSSIFEHFLLLKPTNRTSKFWFYSFKRSFTVPANCGTEKNQKSFSQFDILCSAILLMKKLSRVLMQKHLKSFSYFELLILFTQSLFKVLLSRFLSLYQLLFVREIIKNFLAILEKKPIFHFPLCSTSRKSFAASNLPAKLCCHNLYFPSH